MKKTLLFLSAIACVLSGSVGLIAQGIHTEDPKPWYQHDGYEYIPNVAQYKEPGYNTSWGNIIGISRGISIEEAFKIADNNPNITYFFYTKKKIQLSEGTFYTFHHGDTAFFSGEPTWGPAFSLADGFVKKK